jgi:hypothetical protein
MGRVGIEEESEADHTALSHCKNPSILLNSFYAQGNLQPVFSFV